MTGNFAALTSPDFGVNIHISSVYNSNRLENALVVDSVEYMCGGEYKTVKADDLKGLGQQVLKCEVGECAGVICKLVLVQGLDPLPNVQVQQIMYSGSEASGGAAPVFLRDVPSAISNSTIESASPGAVTAAPAQSSIPVVAALLGPPVDVVVKSTISAAAVPVAAPPADIPTSSLPAAPALEVVSASASPAAPSLAAAAPLAVAVAPAVAVTPAVAPAVTATTASVLKSAAPAVVSIKPLVAAAVAAAPAPAPAVAKPIPAPLPSLQPAPPAAKVAPVIQAPKPPNPVTIKPLGICATLTGTASTSFTLDASKFVANADSTYTETLANGSITVSITKDTTPASYGKLFTVQKCAKMALVSRDCANGGGLKVVSQGMSATEDWTISCTTTITLNH
ncbi:hypothetical protein HDU98_007475 [Podochytrium sp. JEL0797]|nr:hypothetical protein HDU98_007475 [Podochytrium sp. JEL0797]